MLPRCCEVRTLAESDRGAEAAGEGDLDGARGAEATAESCERGPGSHGEDGWGVETEEEEVVSRGRCGRLRFRPTVVGQSGRSVCLSQRGSLALAAGWLAWLRTVRLTHAARLSRWRVSPKRRCSGSSHVNMWLTGFACPMRAKYSCMQAWLAGWLAAPSCAHGIMHAWLWFYDGPLSRPGTGLAQWIGSAVAVVRVQRSGWISVRWVQYRCTLHHHPLSARPSLRSSSPSSARRPSHSATATSASSACICPPDFIHLQPAHFEPPPPHSVSSSAAVKHDHPPDSLPPLLRDLLPRD